MELEVFKIFFCLSQIPIAIGVLKTLTSYSTDVNQVKSILTYSNTVQASDNLEALRDLLQSNMNVNDWLGLKLKVIYTMFFSNYYYVILKS